MTERLLPENDMTEGLLPDIAELRRLSARVKVNATNMVSIQGFGYLGQALSAGDIFATMFGGGFIRPGHDRFVLSPGHYAVVLYAVAAELGYIEREHLASYGLDGAVLEAISTERTPFVDITCGSLGQGLSGAIGLALASRMAGDDRRAYVFMSDGEMQEGQLWEGAMFAAHHELEGLTVVIDANNSQVDGPVSSITTIEPVADKWRAFGWCVEEVDGHDIPALVAAFTRPSPSRPKVVVARTHILGRLRSIPSTVDGHFIKLDDGLAAAVIAELESDYA
ncbi:thiamine pyrophosphate-dependent enzyme [Paraburkholderia nemoris]|uniref:transketolase n=1 Tax=Paraburkholderia nemoris TaxID=2793076 RepID=UPI0038BE012E